MRHWAKMIIAAGIVLAGRTFLFAQRPADLGAVAPVVIRRAELNPDVPLFVPVHPRIATTISFPKAIGEPLGTGFVDAENLPHGSSESKVVRNQGEYVIDYSQGENFFTVQPTAKSQLLNLNIPYEGTTIVLYFYVVDTPLAALASLILEDKHALGSSLAVTRSVHEKGENSTAERAAPEPESIARIRKVDASVPSPASSVSPARLEGFLRKLRMVHAASEGEELTELSAALHVTVAISSAEDTRSKEIEHPVNDAGLYQIVLLRAVRDSNLDAVGFVLLLRNLSDQVLLFDPRTFSARCGLGFYTAQVIDAPAQLKPHQMSVGYFAIVGAGEGRPGYLLPNNDWRISVTLISPAVPAGAGLLVKPISAP